MREPEKLLSGDVQIELRNELKSPATFANAMAINTVNESLVFSFGYFDPMQLKPQPDGTIKVIAPVFAQVAVKAQRLVVGSFVHVLLLEEINGKNRRVSAVSATERERPILQIRDRRN